MTSPFRYKLGDTCKRGHLVAGDNIFWLREGILRCATCETTCANGHLKTPSTWKRSGKQNRCSLCVAIHSASYNQTENGKEKHAKREARRRAKASEVKSESARLAEHVDAEGDLVHKNDEKKTAPWNLLKVRPEAMDNWEQFKNALEELRTPCFERPEDFSDFNDPRYPDDPLEQNGRPFPSAAEAEEECEDCPLASMCLRFALQQREDFGIYGGKRIVGGRVYGEKGGAYA